MHAHNQEEGIDFFEVRMMITLWVDILSNFKLMIRVTTFSRSWSSRLEPPGFLFYIKF
jgi:hypothetical protein